MDQRDNRILIKDYFFIILGASILAASINIFYNPNHLVVGGVTGIGIIISDYSKRILGFPIPLGVTNIVINIPLFLFAYKFMGKSFLGRTVFATLYLSFALFYTEYLPIYTGDITLVAVYGGVFSGIGIGFVFRGLATTGGTDLAAAIMHKFYRHISVSQILFLMDAAIIACGFFAFGAEKAMYAIIAIFISSKFMTTVLEGMSFSIAAFIISDKSEEISTAIFNNVGRGVTSLNGRGMYTGNEKNVLLCVFSQKEITKIKDTVKNIDQNAFMMVTDAKEVLGQGFQSII